MEKETIYSKCGFYCNRCPAYKDNSATEEGRRRGSELWKKYFGLDFKPDIVRCEGCQSAEPWKTGNMLPDRRCHIRACAVYNGVPTCAHCASFPCEEYSKQVPGEKLRQQRESAANTQFTDEEYLKNLEQFEGQPHLNRLHGALSPSDIIQPKPFTSASKIAPFPEKLASSPPDQEKMKRLYLLLSSIFSQKADSYAGQVLTDRKTLYLRGVLWVIILYGEIKDGEIVLDGEPNKDKKECSRLVRKTDNTLHSAVREAVDHLVSFGLRVNFKAVKKSWILTLSIDQKNGGEEVLKALKNYVTNLAEKYGEPEYSGSFDLKGRAFKLFTRVDMNGLQTVVR